MFVVRLKEPCQYAGEYLHRSYEVPEDLARSDHGPLRGAGLYTEEEVQALLTNNESVLEAEDAPDGHREDTIDDLAARIGTDREEFATLADLMRSNFMCSADFSWRVLHFSEPELRFDAEIVRESKDD